VESYIGLPILGVIPFSPIEEKKRFIFPLFPRQKDKLSATKSRLIIYPSIQSSIIEAYRMLDTNFWSTFEEKTYHKIIIVCSSSPGEGKTIVSANLAITMAQRGVRVLLIDADLRRPILYQLFGLKREPGLADILSGNYKPKDVFRDFTDLFLSLKQQESLLQTPGLNNLQFITPGRLPNNPVGLFSSERMSVLTDELRKDFDIVIFDSPPILPVSDVSIFGPKADAVIIVYQVGKTSRSALQRAKKQMESVGAKLKGIVLNCLNPQVEMNRPYYYRHYRYYGKREEKDV
jgi:capsular exopolysaccharide synthesis family protein